jgi:hypothetical protein
METIRDQMPLFNLHGASTARDLDYSRSGRSRTKLSTTSLKRLAFLYELSFRELTQIQLYNYFRMHIMYGNVKTAES